MLGLGVEAEILVVAVDQPSRDDAGVIAGILRDLASGACSPCKYSTLALALFGEPFH